MSCATFNSIFGIYSFFWAISINKMVNLVWIFPKYEYFKKYLNEQKIEKLNKEARPNCDTVWHIYSLEEKKTEKREQGNQIRISLLEEEGTCQSTSCSLLKFQDIGVHELNATGSNLRKIKSFSDLRVALVDIFCQLIG